MRGGKGLFRHAPRAAVCPVRSAWRVHEASEKKDLLELLSELTLGCILLIYVLVKFLPAITDSLLLAGIATALFLVSIFITGRVETVQSRNLKILCSLAGLGFALWALFLLAAEFWSCLVRELTDFFA